MDLQELIIQLHQSKPQHHRDLISWDIPLHELPFHLLRHTDKRLLNLHNLLTIDIIRKQYNQSRWIPSFLVFKSNQSLDFLLGVLFAKSGCTGVRYVESLEYHNMIFSRFQSFQDDCTTDYHHILLTMEHAMLKGSDVFHVENSAKAELPLAQIRPPIWRDVRNDMQLGQFHQFSSIVCHIPAGVPQRTRNGPQPVQ